VAALMVSGPLVLCSVALFFLHAKDAAKDGERKQRCARVYMYIIWYIAPMGLLGRGEGMQSARFCEC